MHGGVSHTIGINKFVSNTVHVTIMWHIKWLVGAVDGTTHGGPALLKGYVPWFKNWGYITWALKTMDPWQYDSEWPDIEQSGLGYLDNILAQLCWGNTQILVRSATHKWWEVLVKPTADGSVSAAIGGHTSSGTTSAGTGDEESARGLQDKINGYDGYVNIMWSTSNATVRGDGLRPARLVRRARANWDMEDVKLTCWNPAVVGMANHIRDHLEERRRKDEDFHVALRATFEQVNYHKREVNPQHAFEALSRPQQQRRAAARASTSSSSTQRPPPAITPRQNKEDQSSSWNQWDSYNWWGSSWNWHYFPTSGLRAMLPSLHILCRVSSVVLCDV